MISFQFWVRWLTTLSILIILFGLGLALLSPTPLFAVIHQQVNPVFWDGSAVPQSFTAFTAWIYAVLGATMAGWGVFLFFIVRYPFREKQIWAYRCIGLGLFTWYIVDSAASLLSGVYFNAVFNTVILILAALPLWAARQEFRAP